MKELVIQREANSPCICSPESSNNLLNEIICSTQITGIKAHPLMNPRPESTYILYDLYIPIQSLPNLLKIKDKGVTLLLKSEVECVCLHCTTEAGLLHTACGTSNSVAPETRLEGISENKAGQFAAVLEVYELAPSLFMVDARKASGETLEYHKFYKNFCAQLENIIWKPPQGCENSSLLHT